MSICTMFSCTKNDDVVSNSNNNQQTGTYIDLGLSSGTKWKISDEKNPNDVEHGYFTYSESIAKFGNKLPTLEQWMELINECDWSGTKVIGPNGGSIRLTAVGYRNCKGSVLMGQFGHYWSYTPSGEGKAWFLNICPTSRSMQDISQCFGQSVRLVQN